MNWHISFLIGIREKTYATDAKAYSVAHNLWPFAPFAYEQTDTAVKI